MTHSKALAPLVAAVMLCAPVTPLHAAPRDAKTPAAPGDPEPPTSEPGAPGPATELASEPDPAPPAEPDPAVDDDVVYLADGTTLTCTVQGIAEGAYVTVTVDGEQRSLRWTDVDRVRILREGKEPWDLDLSAQTFERDMEATPPTPLVTMKTRDGRPVSLLRLRNSTAKPKQRYSDGYDDVCRAPCDRAIERGSNRFFVDSHPWTASEVFELPQDAAEVELLIRPGRVRMRKTGLGLMIGGAIGIPAGVIGFASDRSGGPVRSLGITLMATSLVAVPTGAILFAVSRAKAKIGKVGR